MQFVVSTTYHVEKIEKQRSCEVLVKAHPATKWCSAAAQVTTLTPLFAVSLPGRPIGHLPLLRPPLDTR